DAEGATTKVPGREPLVSVRVDQGQCPRGGARRRLVVEPAGAVRLRTGGALFRGRTGVCPRRRELAGVPGSRPAVRFGTCAGHRPSTATSSARTSCDGTAGSITCRPTLSSSYAGDTARR